MVFSSVTFLVYFLPVFFLLYLVCPLRFRNSLLLIGSILFYSWGAPKFIFVVLGTTVLDFYLVRKMSREHDGIARKIWLSASVLLNLSLLFYFKYFNFFVDNLNEVFQLVGLSSFATATIILPIGISFYTFESITYSVDAYRKVHKPLDNFWDYQLYIIFFPKLIAGPIVRYHEIADQISDRTKYSNATYRLHGFYRFTLGLAKKVLIANTMAQYADDAFQMPEALLNTNAAWIGMISYTFQIYFDFSGYSDMALGLGYMFGFKLPENFDNPYSSSSITEFWRKWHITLGSWMRNYLYIPLGGNKKSGLSTYINLLIVFFASGLWHGASWTFVLWGLYHGLFLVFERKGWIRFKGRATSIAFTFIVVSIGWVLFRADNLHQATLFYKQLFAFNIGDLRFPADAHYYFYLVLAFVFSFLSVTQSGQAIVHRVYSVQLIQSSAFRLVFSMLLFTYCLAALSATKFNPFIYFRF